MALIDSNFFGDPPFEISVPPRRIKVRVERAQNGEEIECKTNQSSVSEAAERSRFDAQSSADELYARFAEQQKSRLSNVYDDDDVRRQRLTKKGMSQQVQAEHAESEDEQAEEQGGPAKTKSQRLWELRQEALSYRSELVAANKATTSRRDESYNEKIARMRGSIQERQQRTVQQLAEKERQLYLKQVQKSSEQRAALENAKLRDEQRLYQLKERQSLEKRTRSFSTRNPARMRSSDIADADAAYNYYNRAKSRDRKELGVVNQYYAYNQRAPPAAKSPERQTSRNGISPAHGDDARQKQSKNGILKNRAAEQSQNVEKSPYQRSASLSQRSPSQGRHFNEGNQLNNPSYLKYSPRTGALVRGKSYSAKYDSMSERSSPHTGNYYRRGSYTESGDFRAYSKPRDSQTRSGLASDRYKERNVSLPRKTPQSKGNSFVASPGALASAEKPSSYHRTRTESRDAARKNETPRSAASALRAGSATRAHAYVLEGSKARPKGAGKQARPSNYVTEQIIAELSTKRGSTRLTDMEQRVQAAKRELLRYKALIRQEELEKAAARAEKTEKAGKAGKPRDGSARQLTPSRRRSAEQDTSFDAHRGARGKQHTDFAEPRSTARLSDQQNALNASITSFRSQHRTPTRRTSAQQEITSRRKPGSANEADRNRYVLGRPLEDRVRQSSPAKRYKATEITPKGQRLSDKLLRSEGSSDAYPKIQKSTVQPQKTPPRQARLAVQQQMTPPGRLETSPERPKEPASNAPTTPKKARSIEKHFLDVQAYILAEMAHIQPARRPSSAKKQHTIAVNDDKLKTGQNNDLYAVVARQAQSPQRATSQQQKAIGQVVKSEKSQLQEQLERYEAEQRVSSQRRRSNSKAGPSYGTKVSTSIGVLDKAKATPIRDNKADAESAQKHRLEAERRAGLVKYLLSQQHDITESARKKARQVESEARSLRYAENAQNSKASSLKSGVRIGFDGSAAHRYSQVRGDYLIRWLDSLVSDEKIIAITTLSTGRTVYQNVPRLQYEQLRGFEGAEVVRKLTKSK